MSKKQFIAWTAIAVAAGIGCAVRAHADPVDSTVVMYAAKSSSAVCSTLQDYPSFEGIAGVIQGIEADAGFTQFQAAESIVISVQARCPQFLPLLQRFADSASPQGKLETAV